MRQAEGNPPNSAEVASHSPLIVDIVRERLRRDPTVFCAGELWDPHDEDRIDEHTFFVAPLQTELSPKNLNKVMRGLLKGTPFTTFQKAYIRDDGDFEIPSAYEQEPIGTRTYATTIKTNVLAGAFQGKTGELVEHETVTEELLQRTFINVYPDRDLAQALFEYGVAQVNGKLDKRNSQNIRNVITIYGTNVLPKAIVEKLKRRQSKLKRLTTR